MEIIFPTHTTDAIFSALPICGESRTRWPSGCNICPRSGDHRDRIASHTAATRETDRQKVYLMSEKIRYQSNWRPQTIDSPRSLLAGVAWGGGGRRSLDHCSQALLVVVIIHEVIDLTETRENVIAYETQVRSVVSRMNKKRIWSRLTSSDQVWVLLDFLFNFTATN